MSLIRLAIGLCAAASLIACIPASEPEPAPPEPVTLGAAPTKFSTTKFYRNPTKDPVPVRSGPDTSAPILTTLDKFEGGMVQTCNEDETRCQITFGEFGATGWVEMSRLKAR